MDCLKTKQIIVVENKVCQRLGKRRGYVYEEITALGVVVMELFYLDCGDGYKNLYVCYNSQNCIPK